MAETGWPLPAHLVHLPVDPGDFFDKKVIKGKKVFYAHCGLPAKMPPRISVEQGDDGQIFLKAGPHRRYYAYCRRCAEKLSDQIELHNVEDSDSMGQPL